MVNPLQRTVRFGLFEVDLTTGELFKAGRKIDLERQPFLVLQLLLKSPGELVNREELHAALWPDGSFVDFDRGLNVAVKKLRDALGDASDNPRFIETLSRRGYRFIAPTDKVPYGKTDPVSLAKKKPNWVIWLSAGATAAVLAIVIYWQSAASASSDLTELELRAVPLTAYPGFERSPSLSPDGKQVAFSWNGEKQDNADIYVKLLDSGHPVRLTTDPATDDMPAWSPDGRRIAFVRSGNLSHGRPTVYVVPALGGPKRKIAELAPFECYGDGSLSWSADSEWLAFSDKNSQDDPFSIYMVSLETGEKRQVTSPEAEMYGDAAPAFSPDGGTLAFVRLSDYSIGDLYVTPRDGGTPTRLTNDRTGHFGLTWIADGKELVFSSERAGGPRLWRIPASGGTPKALLGISGSDAPRGVSQRGHRLVFSRHVSDHNFWRIGVQGAEMLSAPQQLSASTRDDANPQLSPDGKRIAFNSNRSGSYEIWVSDAEGKHAVPVTSLGRGLNSWPSWSPDGRLLAFNSNLSGNWEVYIVDAHGGKPRAITNDPAADFAPSWSRDGKWIFFSSDRTGSLQIWKMTPAGETPTQLTTDGGDRPAVSQDGKFIYYARGEAVWRVPAAGGKEAAVLDPVPNAGFAKWGSTKEGLYFIGFTNARPTLKFFEFGTRRTSDVMPAEKPWDIGALGVSPDGRSLLFTQIDQSGSDLMFVEEFR